MIPLYTYKQKVLYFSLGTKHAKKQAVYPCSGTHTQRLIKNIEYPSRSAGIPSHVRDLHIFVRIFPEALLSECVHRNLPITRRRGLSSLTPSPEESKLSTLTLSSICFPDARFHETAERTLLGRYPLAKMWLVM